MVVPGDEADGHADDQRGAHGDHADEDRDPRAEQEAAVDVASHSVRSEPVRAVGRLEPLRGVKLEHVVGMRGKHGRQERGSPERGDQHEAEQRRPIARQPREDEPRARHAARSRGSTSVCATSTSRFTTMKITPAHTVKPITAS